MIVRWRQKTEPITLRWRGPNRLTTAVENMTQVMGKIAVIAGPPGEKGNDGITTVIHITEGLDDVEVLDGGNF